MPQIHRDCTLLVCSVDGFKDARSKLSPFNIVSLLQEIYTTIEEKVELYNTVCIDKLADRFIIASG